ncbi:hypothetical protein HY573_00225 [Candidatus Parcubacteria bacterium]|nr:hypothetical protein [Candidatus Parcubacteria bacterium]
MAEKKTEFVSALTAAARNDPAARGLVAFVDEQATEVALVRAEPPDYPEISEAEFRELLGTAQQRLKRLGLPGIETYADYLKIVRKIRAGRKQHPGEVPYFRIELPEDWDECRLALCPITPVARQHYLPDGHLSAYAELIAVSAENVSRTCRHIAFTTAACTPYWLGLAGLQSAYIAKQRREDPPEDKKQTLAAAQRSLHAMTSGTPRPLDRARVERQIEGYRFIAQLLSRAIDNMLKPIIESFGFTRSQSKDDLEQCIAFVQQQAEQIAGTPASVLEADARKYLAMHCVLVTALSGRELLDLYCRVPGPAPKPYLLLAD